MKAAGAGKVPMGRRRKIVEITSLYVEDVLDSIEIFFQKTLSGEAAVPKTDAAKAAKLIVKGLKRFTIWQDVP